MNNNLYELPNGDVIILSKIVMITKISKVGQYKNFNIFFETHVKKMNNDNCNGQIDIERNKLVKKLSDYYKFVNISKLIPTSEVRYG